MDEGGSKNYDPLECGEISRDRLVETPGAPYWEAFVFKGKRPGVLPPAPITCIPSSPALEPLPLPSPTPVSVLSVPGPEPIRASLSQAGSSGLGGFSQRPVNETSDFSMTLLGDLCDAPNRCFSQSQRTRHPDINNYHTHDKMSSLIPSLIWKGPSSW